MTTSLGKRKRPIPRDIQPSSQNNLNDSVTDTEEQEEAQKVLQRYFEAQFEPLDLGLGDIRKGQRQPDLDREGSSEESEFNGLSDSEDNGEDTVAVEVVEHVHKIRAEGDEIDRAEVKSFMTSKPPLTPPEKSTLKRSLKKAADSDDAQSEEAAHLQNDLSLQRLLQESHLLDSSLTYSAKNKRKAIDLRLQTLGSKKSLLAQERMPMSHRKGITKKKTEKEDARRREAKENGIVLEKVKRKASDDGKRRRDRGVGAPAVGRFKRGMLSLSRKDVREIVGPGRR